MRRFAIVLALAAYLTTHPEIALVRFVLFDATTYTAHHQALANSNHRA